MAKHAAKPTDDELSEAAIPDTGSSRPTPRRQKGSTKKVPWNFPKNTLEDAISVLKAIEDKNAGHPMRANMLARSPR
jgi:hypothetical protein